MCHCALDVATSLQNTCLYANWICMCHCALDVMRISLSDKSMCISFSKSMSHKMDIDSVGLYQTPVKHSNGSAMAPVRQLKDNSFDPVERK